MQSDVNIGCTWECIRLKLQFYHNYDYCLLTITIYATTILYSNSITDIYSTLSIILYRRFHENSNNTSRGFQWTALCIVYTTWLHYQYEFCIVHVLLYALLDLSCQIYIVSWQVSARAHQWSIGMTWNKNL